MQVKHVFIILGAASIAGTGAWALGSADVGDQDRVVLTRRPPQQLQAATFDNALPGFGDSDTSTAFFATDKPGVGSIASSAPVTPTEAAMTESRFRSVTQQDIARMKAAGIGMVPQGAQALEDIASESAGQSERSLLP